MILRVSESIRPQMNAYLEGFYEIIPKEQISIFNEQELELLISGLPSIDIDDLKANTEYHKYQSNSLQVRFSVLLSSSTSTVFCGDACHFFYRSGMHLSQFLRYV